MCDPQKNPLTEEVLENRCLIMISGSDAKSFLQRIITTDITDLSDDEACPGALLSPQGKILFDFLISRHEESVFCLDCLADTANDFIARLRFYRLHANLDIVKKKEKRIATIHTANLPYSKNTDVRRDKRFSDIPVWRLYSNEGILPPDATTFFTDLRIKYGIAESGPDFMPGELFPHDIGFHRNGAVNFNKGCYIGQEVVSRMEHRSVLRKRIFVINASEKLPPRGASICSGAATLGRLGSVSGVHGLSVLRCDRVEKALEKNEAFFVNHLKVGISLPFSPPRSSPS